MTVEWRGRRESRPTRAQVAGTHRVPASCLLTVDPRESDANHVYAYPRTRPASSLRIIKHGFIELIILEMETIRARQPENMQISGAKRGIYEVP